jgi:uncharacterized protein (TIGR02466 family)
MPKVEMWFPVAVYQEDNLISQEENTELVNYSLELRKQVPSGGEDWYGDTYNTHGTYDLRKDIKFRPLLNLISMHANNFAKMHNSDASYEISYAWLNINTENTYQELHTHNSAIFSCSYYLSAPPGSGGIVFEDPKEPDMFPLKAIGEKNALSFTRIKYAATERSLLIFRSYLRHMVQPGSNIEPRISIAVNFI